MAWTGLVLTTDGRNALNEAQLSGNMRIKAVVVGDGAPPANFRTQKGLVHQLYAVTELKLDRTENGCTVTADFPDVEYDYYFREIGILIDTDQGEKLYVYDNCGEDAQYIVSSTGAEKTRKRLRLSLVIADVPEITVTNPNILYVANDVFEAAVQEMHESLSDHADNKDNPHHVTKEQMGLGNVDNTSDSSKNVNSAKGLRQYTSGQTGNPVVECWYKIAAMTLNKIYEDRQLHGFVCTRADSGYMSYSMEYIARLKQQYAMGDAPYCSIRVLNYDGIEPERLRLYVTENTELKTVAELWCKIEGVHRIHMHTFYSVEGDIALNENMDLHETPPAGSYVEGVACGNVRNADTVDGKHASDLQDYNNLANKPGNMSGATASAAGASGLVPAPGAGAANRYLRSDGTWQTPTPDGIGALPVSGGTVTGVTVFNQGTQVYNQPVNVAPGYLHLCRIKISKTYPNQPIGFKILQRARRGEVHIRFTSTGTTDPTLDYIKKTGDVKAYIVKSVASTWDLYVEKSEAHDNISVTELHKGAYMKDVAITWGTEVVASLPSGYVQATDETPATQSQIATINAGLNSRPTSGVVKNIAVVSALPSDAASHPDTLYIIAG